MPQGQVPSLCPCCMQLKAYPLVAWLRIIAGDVFIRTPETTCTIHPDGKE